MKWILGAGPGELWIIRRLALAPRSAPGGVHPQYPHADPETRQDFDIFITTYYYNSSS